MNRQIDDRITRSEAALLAGCSEDTIKRDIKAHALQTTVGLGGKTMIRIGDLIDIDRISADVLGPGISGADAAALKAARTEVERLAVQCAKLEGRLEELTAVAADLRGQLKTKDQQLANLFGHLDRITVAMSSGNMR